MNEKDQNSTIPRSETPRRSGNDRRDAGLNIRRFEEKHYIFRERETGQEAFIVNSGTVEILKNVDGNDVVIGTLGEGGMFGEMALIDDKPRMASARAVGTVVVKVITRELIEKKIAQMDPFTRGLINLLTDHARKTAEALDGRGTQPPSPKPETSD